MTQKHLFSFSKDYIYFICARVIGIGIKPLLLIYFLNYHFVSEAASISKLFLILSGTLVLYGVPVHFNYYKRIFDKGEKFLKLRKPFNIYLTHLFIHGLLITPIVYILILSVTQNIFFSTLILILLLSEKAFDEIQRFFQFSKEFGKWSIHFLLKNLIPFFLVLIYSQCKLPHPDYFYILTAILCTIFSNIYFVPKFIQTYLKKNILSINKEKTIDYIKVLKEKHWKRFAQSISSANILTADKWVASILYPELFFSELMIISQISNGINIGSSNLIIAHRRKELLQSKNSIKSLWMNGKAPLIIFLLGIIVFIALIVFKSMFQQLNEITLFLALGVLCSYLTFALTGPFIEYLFWNGNIKITLLIDSLYFIITLSSGVLLYFYGNYQYICIFFFISNLYRLVSQLFYTKRLSQTLSK